MTCHLGSQMNCFAGLQRNRGSAPQRVEKDAEGVLCGGFVPQIQVGGNLRGSFQLGDTPQGIVGVAGDGDEVGTVRVEGDGTPAGEVLPEGVHCKVGGGHLAWGIRGVED